MALFSGKMMASGQGGNFYTLLEAKRASLNDASYRKPTGMFDVATSSSGEVYAINGCLLYTSPSPRDKRQSRMPSSA